MATPRNRNLAYIENGRVRIDEDNVSVHGINDVLFDFIAKRTKSEISEVFTNDKKRILFRYFTYKEVSFFT